MPSSNCLLISLRRKTCNGVAENTSLGLKAPSLCDVQRNYEAMKEENLSGFALLVPLMLQFINGSECFTHNKRQSSRVLNVHLQYDFNQDNDSRGSCQRSSFSDARLLRFHNVTFRQKMTESCFQNHLNFKCALIWTKSTWNAFITHLNSNSAFFKPYRFCIPY